MLWSFYIKEATLRRRQRRSKISKLFKKRKKQGGIHMLSKLTVRTALRIGFITVGAIAAVAIVGAIFLMNAQKNAYESLIDNEIEAAHLITEIRLEANIASRNIYAMALAPGDASNADLETAAYSAFSRMDANVQAFKEVYNLSDDMENRYIEAITAWGQTVPDIIDAIDRGDGEWAAQQIRGNSGTLLATMVNLGTQIEDQLNQEQVEAIARQETYSNAIIIALLVFLIAASIFVFALAHSLVIGIIVPTQQVRDALVGFSEGKLNVPVEYESGNELGQMCDALRTSQTVLTNVIGDSCHLLEEMSKGNFNVRTTCESAYVGDLTNVLQSIRVINTNLSDTLAQISLSAEQVSADSVKT
jgi:methyl-accepting chemotaxis protein